MSKFVLTQVGKWYPFSLDSVSLEHWQSTLYSSFFFGNMVLHRCHLGKAGHHCRTCLSFCQQRLAFYLCERILSHLTGRQLASFAYSLCFFLPCSASTFCWMPRHPVEIGCLTSLAVPSYFQWVAYLSLQSFALQFRLLSWTWTRFAAFDWRVSRQLGVAKQCKPFSLSPYWRFHLLSLQAHFARGLHRSCIPLQSLENWPALVSRRLSRETLGI